MVSAATIRPGAQEAGDAQFGHTRSFAGIYDMVGAVNVHGLIGLLAHFSIDSSAMDDGVAATECFRQSS